MIIAVLSRTRLVPSVTYISFFCLSCCAGAFAQSHLRSLEFVQTISSIQFKAAEPIKAILPLRPSLRCLSLEVPSHLTCIGLNWTGLDWTCLHLLFTFFFYLSSPPLTLSSYFFFLFPFFSLSLFFCHLHLRLLQVKDINRDLGIDNQLGFC